MTSIKANKSREFEDYNVFSDGVSTVETFIDNLNTHKSNFATYRNMIEKDGIFKGDIATSCFEAFDELEKMLLTLSEKKYPKVVEALNQYSSANKESQEAARDKILNTYLTLDQEGNLQMVQAGLYGNTTQEKIYNFLRQKGYSKAAACGILANIEGESGFNYNAVGDGGTSYGLCQWHSSRWSALQNYCNRNNLDWRSLEGQLEYLVYELSSNYSWVNSYIKSVPDTAEGASQAAYKWTTDFEVCANSSYWGSVRGQNAATSYWSRFNA